MVRGEYSTDKAAGLEDAVLTIPVTETQQKPFVMVESPQITLDKWFFSPFFKERPDVNMKIADNDMNTWEPAAADGIHNAQERGFLSDCLHRTPALFPCMRILRLERIQGR